MIDNTGDSKVTYSATNTVSINDVIQIVNDSIYTQRTIEDRVSNPHGEHAEDVWILKKSVLKDIVTSRITSAAAAASSSSTENKQFRIVLNI